MSTGIERYELNDAKSYTIEEIQERIVASDEWLRADIHRCMEENASIWEELARR